MFSDQRDEIARTGELSDMGISCSEIGLFIAINYLSYFLSYGTVWCRQQVRVTRQRSGLGPDKRFSLVPDLSENHTHFVSMGWVLGPHINPRFFGWVEP